MRLVTPLPHPLERAGDKMCVDVEAARSCNSPTDPFRQGAGFVLSLGAVQCLLGDLRECRQPQPRTLKELEGS